MNKALAQFTVSALIAGALGIAGCESHNSKYSSTEYEMGDTNSQAYHDFDNVAHGLNDVGGDMIDGIFEQSGMILEMGSSSVSKERSPFSRGYATAETDSFVASYNSDTKWWHAYWSYADSAKGLTAVVQDSIQFVEGTTAVQWPDTATITDIHCGQSVAFNLTGEHGSITITATSEWTVSGAPGAIPSGGEITINGGVSHEIEANGLSVGCTTDLTMSAAYNNVKSTLPELQASESCPESGTIHLHGTAHSTCESDSASVSIDGIWDWLASFDEGEVFVTVNDGHFEWNYSGPCGGDEPPTSMVKW